MLSVPYPQQTESRNLGTLGSCSFPHVTLTLFYVIPCVTSTKHNSNCQKVKKEVYLFLVGWFVCTLTNFMSTVSKLEKVSGPEPHKNKLIGINYIKRQMGELVERVLHDLKVMGSFPAWVQFWLTLKYSGYIFESSWLMIMDLHTG